MVHGQLGGAVCDLFSASADDATAVALANAERAALALAEAVARLSDRADPVPDEIWDDTARRYAAPALAALVISIATTNVWNRLNVATRQEAGGWTGTG